MLWKSEVPEDMAELIEAARLSALAAHTAGEGEDWDGDEDYAGGPKIIQGDGDAGEDDDELE
jgi:hypothetical protein